MEYCLRRAEAKDYAVINDLFMEMLRTIYEKDEVQGYKEGDLDHYFSGGEDWICVAEKNGSIVAFLSIEVHREEVNYLYYDDFCVREKYRGMGIGTALMNEAENFCRTIGFENIVLHVEKSNALARKLYEKREFSVLRDDGSRLCLIKHVAGIILR